ncbi:MAG: transcription termination/antitermination protein NusG [Bacteroidales bacterium]|nr:transcription termination/antitermination protein NusG [Bacteroidales bacterium]
MSENVKKWYVLRAIGGKEKKVKEYLESEIVRLKLQDYITQVLIPTEKVYQIRAGKKVSKERTFFPGYVIVEAALVGEVPHVLRNIPNVLGFLGTQSGEPPTPIRKAEINRILGKVDELAASEEELNVPFVVGETVKVIDGPFNSFSGVIEEVNEKKRKLKVMVKIFGRKTPLELSFMQVERKEN